MGHNRNLADYAHHFDGTHIDLGSGNIETQGVLTYEDVTNVDAIGIVTARAGVRVPDSQTISLGTGNDFAITHDGTNTTFINDTGQIQIRNRADDQDIILQTDDGSGGVAVYLRCDGSSGQVDLNHYGSRKLYTSSTGATVTGALVSGSVTSELDLTAISSSTSDTAVDVFVYDTRKDSDGGAWRKRTQHTSWYNETLGTSSRGSRKEFPAVAVIVLDDLTTTGRMTIYDGDDPDLPMWMVFTGGASAQEMLPSFTGTKLVTVSALNGQICVGNNTYDLEIIDFLKDGGTRVSTGQYINNHNISTRNSALQSSPTSTGSGLVNRAVNDVAMTVLLNAPIDDTTGLPVPTIAVATNGGTSIIKDDGTVVDIGVRDATTVDFTDDHNIIIGLDYFGNGYLGPIPSVDVGDTTYRTDYIWFQPGGGGNITHLGPDGSSGEVYVNKKALYSSEGLSFYDADLVRFTTTSSAVAYVTTSYNTGWMHGDIKGAFLSDTDTTNVTVGSAHYTETFTGSGDNTWGVAGSATISGGVLTLANAADSRATDLTAASSLTTGQKYIAEIEIVSNTSQIFQLDDDGAGAGQGSVTTYGGCASGKTGTFLIGFTKTGSPRMRLIRLSGGPATITSFKIYTAAEQDRSVNNNGLQVFGTVTKSAVATGADLVAYSGFSASNHLAQPYNSDLNPGSGSYSVVAWFKTESNNSGSGVITGLGNADSDEVMLVYVNSSYGIYFDYGSSTEYLYLSDSNQRSMVRDGNWHQVVCQVTAGQVGEIYIDGIKRPTANNVAAPSTWSQWDTNYQLYVGCGRGLGTLPFSGSISLVRYSLSKISTEQIKKNV